ncbi:MAG: pilus assembly protein TadG-related protein [Pseudomonadota bacterium]
MSTAIDARVKNISATRRLARFGRDEDGSFIIFSMFMLVLMLMIAGISVDIERYEVARTKLQATVDGAALSAASLSQDIPAETMVKDYLRVHGMATFFEDVEVSNTVNNKSVTVETHVTVPTHWMNMIGIPALAGPVSATAAESISNLEISMVLDVSGSMGQGSKLPNLKTAAGEFVETILNTASPDSAAISVVPYTTQVSAGPNVLAHMQDAIKDPHARSHCLNFSGTDFDTTAIDLSADSYSQTVHFDVRNNSWTANMELVRPECATREWSDMMVMSQDVGALQSYFNAFRATDWTSIELGVKWGAALLDPSFSPVIDGMISEGDVDNVFAGRPSVHGDRDTRKYMVVMTDGINTNEHRIIEPYRTGASRVFEFRDASDRPFYSIWAGTDEPIDADGTIKTRDDGWYLVNTHAGSGATVGWTDTPYGGVGATRMSWREVFAAVPTKVLTDTWFKPRGGAIAAEGTAIKNAIKATNRPIKDANLRAVCDSAKTQGVTIYTISFEAPKAARTLLRDCATSAATAFDVKGTEISQAFAAIAADINRLRLVN